MKDQSVFYMSVGFVVSCLAMCLALNAINSALQSALYTLPLHNHHHQSELQDSQETINPIAPQKPPHIITYYTYVASLWTSPPCYHLTP